MNDAYFGLYRLSLTYTSLLRCGCDVLPILPLQTTTNLFANCDESVKIACHGDDFGNQIESHSVIHASHVRRDVYASRHVRIVVWD